MSRRLRNRVVIATLLLLVHCARSGSSLKRLQAEPVAIPAEDVVAASAAEETAGGAPGGEADPAAQPGPEDAATVGSAAEPAPPEEAAPDPAGQPGPEDAAPPSGNAGGSAPEAAGGNQDAFPSPYGAEPPDSPAQNTRQSRGPPIKKPQLPKVVDPEPWSEPWLKKLTDAQIHEVLDDTATDIANTPPTDMKKKKQLLKRQSDILQVLQGKELRKTVQDSRTTQVDPDLKKATDLDTLGDAAGQMKLNPNVEEGKNRFSEIDDVLQDGTNNPLNAAETLRLIQDDQGTPPRGPLDDAKAVQQAVQEQMRKADLLQQNKEKAVTTLIADTFQKVKEDDAEEVSRRKKRDERLVALRKKAEQEYRKLHPKQPEPPLESGLGNMEKILLHDNFRKDQYPTLAKLDAQRRAFLEAQKGFAHIFKDTEGKMVQGESQAMADLNAQKRAEYSLKKGLEYVKDVLLKRLDLNQMYDLNRELLENNILPREKIIAQSLSSRTPDFATFTTEWYDKFDDEIDAYAQLKTKWKNMNVVSVKKLPKDVKYVRRVLVEEPVVRRAKNANKGKDKAAAALQLDVGSRTSGSTTSTVVTRTPTTLKGSSYDASKEEKEKEKIKDEIQLEMTARPATTSSTSHSTPSSFAAIQSAIPGSSYDEDEAADFWVGKNRRLTQAVPVIPSQTRRPEKHFVWAPCPEGQEAAADCYALKDLPPQPSRKKLEKQGYFDESAARGAQAGLDDKGGVMNSRTAEDGAAAFAPAVATDSTKSSEEGPAPAPTPAASAEGGGVAPTSTSTPTEGGGEVEDTGAGAAAAAGAKSKGKALAKKKAKKVKCLGAKKKKRKMKKKKKKKKKATGGLGGKGGAGGVDLDDDDEDDDDVDDDFGEAGGDGLSQGGHKRKRLSAGLNEEEGGSRKKKSLDEEEDSEEEDSEEESSDDEGEETLAADGTDEEEGLHGPGFPYRSKYKLSTASSLTQLKSAQPRGDNLAQNHCRVPLLPDTIRPIMLSLYTRFADVKGLGFSEVMSDAAYEIQVRTSNDKDWNGQDFTGRYQIQNLKQFFGLPVWVRSEPKTEPKYALFSTGYETDGKARWVLADQIPMGELEASKYRNPEQDINLNDKEKNQEAKPPIASSVYHEGDLPYDLEPGWFKGGNTNSRKQIKMLPLHPVDESLPPLQQAFPTEQQQPRTAKAKAKAAKARAKSLVDRQLLLARYIAQGYVATVNREMADGRLERQRPTGMFGLGAGTRSNLEEKERELREEGEEKEEKVDPSEVFGQENKAEDGAGGEGGSSSSASSSSALELGGSGIEVQAEDNGSEKERESSGRNHASEKLRTGREPEVRPDQSSEVVVKRFIPGDNLFALLPKDVQEKLEDAWSSGKKKNYAKVSKTHSLSGKETSTTPRQNSERTDLFQESDVDAIGATASSSSSSFLQEHESKEQLQAKKRPQNFRYTVLLQNPAKPEIDQVAFGPQDLEDLLGEPTRNFPRFRNLGNKVLYEIDADDSEQCFLLFQDLSRMHKQKKLSLFNLAPDAIRKTEYCGVLSVEGDDNLCSPLPLSKKSLAVKKFHPKALQEQEQLVGKMEDPFDEETMARIKKAADFNSVPGAEVEHEVQKLPWM
ncbi:unnamed protein product [Amoebophrya sp. A120]|nr:unnamed protein product [Amoebophrya sp. A120]|eukprot:GSA120T00024713001.1